MTTSYAGSTLGRVAAALAVAVAAVHLLLLDSGGTTEALVLAAMALACLPCAWHLWRSPTVRVWAVTAGVDAVMAVLHLRMMRAQPAGGDMAGMHVHDAASGGTSAVMWLALALVLTQLAVAAVAALRRPVLERKPVLHAAEPAVTQM